MSKGTITLTFSEAVENHTGMEIIGEKVQNGFLIQDLETLNGQYKKESELIYLNEPIDDEMPEAAILIFKNGLETIFGINPKDLMSEQSKLEVDKKCFMYGRVVNKKARYNLCFADFDQAPNYEEKKGTVVNFNKLPLLQKLREGLHEKFGEKFKNLFAEGNYYYDANKCYIGYHGDTERKKVVGVRLGEEFPLRYQWYQRGEKVGESIQFNLGDGDIYIMDEKATGNDWKQKSKLTLRHAAGRIIE